MYELKKAGVTVAVIFALLGLYVWALSLGIKENIIVGGLIGVLAHQLMKNYYPER